MVEKIDLKGLLSPVCAEFWVLIANQKGWANLYMFVEMMGRGSTYPTACVRDWPEDAINEIEFVRFGLNRDSIDGHPEIIWIDNLTTGSGENLADPKHDHHNMLCVQN